MACTVPATQTRRCFLGGLCNRRFPDGVAGRSFEAKCSASTAGRVRRSCSWGRYDPQEALRLGSSSHARRPLTRVSIAGAKARRHAIRPGCTLAFEGGGVKPLEYGPFGLISTAMGRTAALRISSVTDASSTASSPCASACCSPWATSAQRTSSPRCSREQGRSGDATKVWGGSQIP